MSIQKISHNEKIIIHADFRGLNEQAMIEQVDKIVEILLAENKSQLLLYEYGPRNYITKNYMHHLEEAGKKAIPFVAKSAIVAELNLAKKMILKAYNFLFNRNIIAFETREEALRYLTE